jgi:hypothetical protein
MIFSNKRNLESHPPLFLNNCIIQEVKKHKHLGVTLSRNLKWTDHFEEITRACSARLNMLRALKFKLNRKMLESIYFSFIQPKLEYGDVLFAGAPVFEINKLDLIEKDAIRIITGVTFRCKKLYIDRELGWDTLHTRRKIHLLVQLYKIIHQKAPSYLCVILTDLLNRDTDHSYNLRPNSKLKLPFSRTLTFKNSFFPLSMKLWNELEDDTRNIDTINAFKRRLTKKKSVVFKILYYGERWASIHHCRIRTCCSLLNYHLNYYLHVKDTSKCRCGAKVEDSYHFFFNCPLYDYQRQKLLAIVGALCTVSLDVLLYGSPNLVYNDNCTIFKAVHDYIKSTKRFI